MDKQFYKERIHSLIRSLKRYEEYAYIFDVFSIKGKPFAFAVGQKDNFKFLMLELKSSENINSLLGRTVYIGRDLNRRKYVKIVMRLGKKTPKDIKRRLCENPFAQRQLFLLITKATSLTAKNASENDFMRYIDDLEKVISLGFAEVLAQQYAEELGESDPKELIRELTEDWRKLISRLKNKLEWIKSMSSPLRCDHCGAVLKGVKKRRGRGRKPFAQTEEIICPRCGLVLKVR